MIGNMPALNKSCTCQCSYGGTISISFAGQTKVQDGANAIAAAWDKITDQIGRENQIKLYRASLGL